MIPLPRISIVTPSLNQGLYIERTIRSVLDQQYPDLEYIIVDGGSSDGTIDILKKFRSQVSWTSEKDRGQSHAINKGLALSTGEVCAFLNADDLYEPGALERVGEFFSTHPERYWLTGRCRIIDADDREIRKPVTAYKNFWLYGGSYTVLNVLNYISQPATFWRRRILREMGPLDENLYYGMDYDYWLRIGKRYRLETMPQYLASFRVHSSSKTRVAVTRQFEELWKIARRHCPSGFLLGLHQMHRAVETTVYHWLLDRERRREKKKPAGGGEKTSCGT
jgi:glycosyltransferase involved in cell wall biosynthesis